MNLCLANLERYEISIREGISKDLKNSDWVFNESSSGKVSRSKIPQHLKEWWDHTEPNDSPDIPVEV